MSLYMMDREQEWLDTCEQQLDGLPTEILIAKYFDYFPPDSLELASLRDMLLDVLIPEYADRQRNRLIREGLWYDRTAIIDGSTGAP